MKTPARPCNASDITWHGLGGQCLNCGATAAATYLLKHAPQSLSRDTVLMQQADARQVQRYDAWVDSLATNPRRIV